MTSTSNIETALDLVVAFAKQKFQENAREGFVPVALLVFEAEFKVAALVSRDRHELAELREALVRDCRRLGARALIVITDTSWVQRPKDGTDPDQLPLPSTQPDRKEALAVMLFTRNRSRLVQLPCHREGPEILWDPPGPLNEGQHAVSSPWNPWGTGA